MATFGKATFNAAKYASSECPHLFARRYNEGRRILN